MSISQKSIMNILKKGVIILIAILPVFSIKAQKLIRYDEKKVQFTYNDSLFQPIHALDFGGIKSYFKEELNVDLFYGLTLKNSTQLVYPYILIGVETIKNPPFDSIIDQFDGVNLSRENIELAVGQKLPDEISDINAIKPVFDRDNNLFIIVSKMKVNEEEAPVINIQVYKLGKNQRALISLFVYDNDNKDIYLKEFWKIAYNFSFDEKYTTP